ncbi:divergent polysaccharide deacetylase family protein [bacterium]|nr:divergent polysaccharide deacetylase family protein [bacterium]
MLLLVFLLITLVSFGCDAGNISQSSADSLKQTSKERTIQPWHSAKIDTVEKVIYDIAHELKIPYGTNTKFSPNVYPNVIRYEDKSTNNPRQIFLRFMLNREILDLNYANMILKQEIEKANGKLIEGIVFANWKEYLVGHKLTFRNQDESLEYVIRLVYDRQLYSDAQQSQEISVILTELGDNNQIIIDNLDFIKSKNITLALDGEGSFCNDINNLAITNNIETMLTIPLEAYPSHNSYNQLNAIKVQSPIEEEHIVSEISYLHDNIGSIKGLTHYWGDFASSEEEFMQHIIDYCKQKNLYYIDARTTSKSKGFNLALRSQVLSSWALSYSQVSFENMTNYLNKNNNPVIILPFNSSADIEKLKKIISFIDRKNYRIVYVSDLLNTDLPIIE